MARYVEPTEEQLALWKEWVADRPEIIKELAKRFDPWTLYRLKTTGQLVTVSSFHENNTLTVNVSADFNIVLHERAVFGINPDDMEEAELPEKPGMALLTDAQVDEHIDALRVLVRPDLFAMDEQGIAQRKH